MLQVESQVVFKMPMDFGQYLLSSSPPAFRSNLTNYCSYRPLYQKSVASINRSPKISRKHPPGFKLKSIILERDCRLKSPGSDGEQCDGLSSPESPVSNITLPCQRLKTKKRVSFADSNGLALCQVRVMSEPSDMPPNIHPEILSSLTDGECAGVTDQPPLVLDFKQPASDYLKFREKLENNCVSLENVVIRDYSLIGTIKVKNISFDKDVSLRVTFDSWNSTSDVHAKYVTSGTDEASRFDTFSFEINVPTNSDPQKIIQFAVCYQTCDKQYWDNNDGENYKVFSSYYKHANTNDKKPFGIGDIDPVQASWTEFSSWSRLDTTLPYW